MNGPILAWAQSRGFLAAWAPLSVLDVVRADIEGRRAAGEIDETFARENLDRAFPGAVALNSAFDYAHRSGKASAWRVLVVVMPRPAHLVTFLAAGRRVDAVMPPTYQRYRPIFEDIRHELIDRVLAGAVVQTLNAPLKALAARLGLVRYGRNNITYAPSIGSYLQIVGYLTDAHLPLAVGWEPREPALLDECAECSVCEAVCPTGAVTGDRVLLRAERCLTVANETPGGWQPWVPASAHNCLIGCLLCQRACPANPTLPVAPTGVVFSEEETRTLLSGGDRSGPVWTSIRGRLEQLGQPYQEDVLGRNLHALLQTSREGREAAAAIAQTGVAAD